MMADEEYRFFQVKESGTLSVIQFRAAITAAGVIASEVQAEVNGFVARHDCRKLVFDLSTTAYLPSNLIGILAVLSGKGVEVHLANASDDVVNVMEVMGLNKRIRINEFEVAAYEEEKPKARQVPRVALEGYYIPCPMCEATQRLDKHQLGKTADCSNCHNPIHVDAEFLKTATELYCPCPGCERELKLPIDALTAPMRCEFCDAAMLVRRVV